MYSKEELENLIKEHAQKYYDGESEISDKEFDDLVDQLRSIDPESPCLTSVGWGYDINKSSGKKVAHEYQIIGSLEKSKTFETIRSEFKEDPIVISAKLDGISAVCYFINGTLVRAVTRGDGSIGIDITDKISKIAPVKLSGFLRDLTGSIRGELVISNENWAKLIEKNPDLKSQRNYASGIINRNEITDDLQYVSFIPYNVLGMEGYYKDYIDQGDIISYLADTYDRVVPCVIGAKDWTFEYLESLYKQFGTVFPVDGVVLTEMICKVEDDGAVKYSQQAVKFESGTKDTLVRRVEWNLTRTGKMAPVVLIDPVDLDGATISRVTGFNAEFIKFNGIDTGAIVTVQRSNLVIPNIDAVVKEAVVNLPTVCPECGAELKWSGADLVCDNEDCVGYEFSSLMHWTNVVAPVDGIGGTIKEKFYEEWNVRSINDLYSTFSGYTGADIGNSSTDKKLSEMLRKLIIDNVDIVKILVGMNIKRLGVTSATKIAENIDLVYDVIREGDISTGTYRKLLDILGPSTTDSIYSSKEKFIDILVRMRNRIIVKEKDILQKEQINIAVTGALSMKRSDFEKIANEHGYVLCGNLKNCKYLVTNTPDSGSSKNAAADKFGVQKITEEEFMKLIGG